VANPLALMYMDKLDGRITQEFFDKQAGIGRKEPDGVLRRITGRTGHQHASPDESGGRNVLAAIRRRAAPITPDGD
jgi:hypothetical protein